MEPLRFVWVIRVAAQLGRYPEKISPLLHKFQKFSHIHNYLLSDTTV